MKPKSTNEVAQKTTAKHRTLALALIGHYCRLPLDVLSEVLASPQCALAGILNSEHSAQKVRKGKIPPDASILIYCASAASHLATNLSTRICTQPNNLHPICNRFADQLLFAPCCSFPHLSRRLVLLSQIEPFSSRCSSL